jgi:hypothetical protein
LASSRIPNVALDALAVERMASGHLCLNLSERVAWEDFPAYAAALLHMIGGTQIDSTHLVEARILDVFLRGATLSLIWSDYPVVVSLESSSTAGDELILELNALLQRPAVP